MVKGGVMGVPPGAPEGFVRDQADSGLVVGPKLRTSGGMACSSL